MSPPSVRLSIPPLRLLSAFMWRVAEHCQVEYYTRLEEFVSVVLEVMPDLLTAEEKVELLLGLRAKVSSKTAGGYYQRHWHYHLRVQGQA